MSLKKKKKKEQKDRIMPVTRVRDGVELEEIVIHGVESQQAGGISAVSFL